MSLLEFLKPSNPTVPPPGTSSHKAYLRATGSTPEQGAAAYKAQQSIPSPGTSAYKAYQYTQKHGKTPPSLVNIITGDTDPNNPSPRSYSSSARSGSSGANAVVDYLNADLAQYYGMSKTTAYQEALSNTAYQRAVQDMRDAGLSPSVLFGTGHGQSANSSIYASEAPAGGGGGGYSRRYGSGSSGNGKLFSGSTYSAITAIGGLVGMAVTKNVGGYWVGAQTAKGAMGLANTIYQKRK